MSKDRLVRINSKEFVLALRMLNKSFPNFIDEKVKYFSAMASDYSIGCLFVVTENYIYLYDASNGISFSKSILFEIPIKHTKAVGLATIGLTDVVYVTLHDGTVIPLKIYKDKDYVVSTVIDLNTIVKQKIITSNKGKNKYKSAAMVLVKPFEKMSGEDVDYLSPYEFQTMNDASEYFEKREKMISKIKEYSIFGKEGYQKTVELVDINVNEYINCVCCPSCHTEMKIGTKFCVKCGKPIVFDDANESCPKCGASIKKGSKFCVKCGMDLSVDATESYKEEEETQTTKQTVETVISRYFNLINKNGYKMYHANQMNDAKVNKIKAAISGRISKNNILYFIDDTVMSSAKRGIVFTEEEIISKDLMEEAIVVPYTLIDKVVLKDNGNRNKEDYDVYFHLKNGATRKTNLMSIDSEQLYNCMKDLVAAINDCDIETTKEQSVMRDNSPGRFEDEELQSQYEKHLEKNTLENENNIIRFNDLLGDLEQANLADLRMRADTYWDSLSEFQIPEYEEDMIDNEEDIADVLESLNIINRKGKNENAEYDIDAFLANSKLKIEEDFVADNVSLNEEEKVQKDLKTDEHEKESIVQNNSVSYIEELKMLKELLDCGILTEEEFEKKKSQILGL